MAAKKKIMKFGLIFTHLTLVYLTWHNITSKLGAYFDCLKAEEVICSQRQDLDVLMVKLLIGIL